MSKVQIRIKPVLQKNFAQENTTGAFKYCVLHYNNEMRQWIYIHNSIGQGQ